MLGERRELPVLGLSLALGVVLGLWEEVVLLGLRLSVVLVEVLGLVVGLWMGVGSVLVWAGFLLDVGTHHVIRVQARGRVAGEAVQTSLHLQLLRGGAGGTYHQGSMYLLIYAFQITFTQVLYSSTVLRYFI